MSHTILTFEESKKAPSTPQFPSTNGALSEKLYQWFSHTHASSHLTQWLWWPSGFTHTPNPKGKHSLLLLKPPSTFHSLGNDLSLVPGPFILTELVTELGSGARETENKLQSASVNPLRRGYRKCNPMFKMLLHISTTDASKHTCSESCRHTLPQLPHTTPKTHSVSVTHTI